MDAAPTTRQGLFFIGWLRSRGRGAHDFQGKNRSNHAGVQTGGLRVALTLHEGRRILKSRRLTDCGERSPPLRQEVLVFVDSGARFGYSGILARCCAWGLCVGPPATGIRRWGDACSPGPSRSITSELMFRGIGGNRLPAVGFEFRRALLGANPAQPESFLRASSRDPHPNRFVWQWVEIGPVRLIARA
jgi:hypothetical protein